MSLESYKANYPKYLQSYTSRISPFQQVGTDSERLEVEKRIINDALERPISDNYLQVDVKNNSIVVTGKCVLSDIILVIHLRGNKKSTYTEKIRNALFKFTFSVPCGYYDIKLFETKTMRIILGKSNVFVGTSVPFSITFKESGFIVQFNGRGEGLLAIIPEENELLCFGDIKIFKVQKGTKTIFLRHNTIFQRGEIRFYSTNYSPQQIKEHTPYLSYQPFSLFN